MSAKVSLSDEDKNKALGIWLKNRDEVLKNVNDLTEIGLHKQVANRLLEPYAWSHVILTATEFANFFNLRTDEGAQPEIKALANSMLIAYNESKPTKLSMGEWHLPYLRFEDYSLNLETQKALSVARCARVSYLNHDGTTPEIDKDLELHDRLLKYGHMSPFEHQATPNSGWWGNFKGWKQYRKYIPNENRDTFNYTGNANE